MSRYFNENDSIFKVESNHTQRIIKTIAHRYMAENPARSVTYRAYNKNGIRRQGDYRYHFNFMDIFPDALNENIVYAWAKLWSDKETDINLMVSGYGPVTVFVNGCVAFKTNILNERDSDLKSGFKAALYKGWNCFLLKFIKTPGGFGGLLGPASYRSLPLHFVMPSADRGGQEGWIYTSPAANVPEDFQEGLLKPGMTEEETGMKWYPESNRMEHADGLNCFKRMYGLRKNCYAIGWTSGCFDNSGLNEYELNGSNAGSVTIYIDQQIIYYSGVSGKINKKIRIESGNHDILVKCACTEDDWGFNIVFTGNKGPAGNKIPVDFKTPHPIEGAKDPWLYAGVFDEAHEPDMDHIRDMNDLLQSVDGLAYWRLDLSDTWIRPYNENINFGKWNYPLGVTLYGLLNAGKLLGQTDMTDYVAQHVNECTSRFRYSLWDREQYGAAGVNHLLTTISCLDDCGSFGSLMLETAKTADIKDYRIIADHIADFIKNKLTRLSDGAFFREDPKSAVAYKTLWADDLYMSVPFLCRMYQLTGDASYISDAAKQFLHYRSYLFIPDKKIMSHVFDFKKNMATGVPWGRGNGWVAFSLTELLAVIPEDHPDRKELLHIFNELCEGYLALQDQEGMWHQVLTDWESYSETSCTSMFIYAFARGVRFGWLENKKSYSESAFRAWEALCRISIDKYGNIYGVCRGSGFSFTSDYYKNDLSWNLNDTHGIGIVLLAGLEVLNLSRLSDVNS